MAIQYIFRVFILFLALASTPIWAKELVISANSNYTVTADMAELELEKLIIGDKATIYFEKDMLYWDVEADYVEIGSGVVIDGSGALGGEGQPGEEYDKKASSCRKGAAGRTGESGENGHNGLDMHLRLKIAKIGSMKIISDGGIGGQGGQGGLGQNGVKSSTCKPTSGGNGGKGGNGGNGGDGGNIVVSLISLDPETSALAFSHRVRVSSDPGKGGPGGVGGLGGEGSAGKFVKRKTLSGDSRWQEGGRPGRTGVDGDPGERGDNGRVFVGGGDDQSFGHTGDLPYKSARQKKEVEITDLKEQLEDIMERMDTLEAKDQGE
jgi:hypothetical protein